jgi:hypothetical protein
MRQVLACACALNLIGCAGDAGPDAAVERQPIFRYVKLEADSLNLGEPWPGAARLGANAADTAIVLPPGSFGGAEGIVVYRERSGRVRRVDFVYGVERDVESMLREYTKTLGRRTTVERYTLGGGLQQRWIWRDPRTEFALTVFVPPQGPIQAIAQLSDRSGVPR